MSLWLDVTEQNVASLTSAGLHVSVALQERRTEVRAKGPERTSQQKVTLCAVSGTDRWQSNTERVEGTPNKHGGMQMTTIQKRDSE